MSPILYSSKMKPEFKLKEVFELTIKEAKAIIAFQPMYSFSEDQAELMITIVKDFIDKTQKSCVNCGGGSSIRIAKDKLIRFYKANQEVISDIASAKAEVPIDEMLNEPEIAPPIPKQLSITEQKKAKKKTKNG